MSIKRPIIFKTFPEVQVNFRLCEIESVLEANPDLVMIREQQHGDQAVYVAEQKTVEQADGLYTDRTKLKLAVRTADCLPVLFYCADKGIVGAVHAGRKGTEKKILFKTFEKIKNQFGISAENCYFYFGPAAQTCCYEKDFVNDNLYQLLQAGVPKENIEIDKACTIHNQSMPSHRRQGDGRKQTMVSIIEKI